MGDGDRHKPNPTPNINHHAILGKSLPRVMRRQALKLQPRSTRKPPSSPSQTSAPSLDSSPTTDRSYQHHASASPLSRRLAALRPLLDRVDRMRGDGPVVVRHHAGPCNGGGVREQKQGGGRVCNVTFCRLGEQMVDDAMPEHALKGDFVGGSQGGEGSESDGFSWGHGCGDVDAFYVM